MLLFTKGRIFSSCRALLSPPQVLDPHGQVCRGKTVYTWAFFFFCIVYSIPLNQYTTVHFYLRAKLPVSQPFLIYSIFLKILWFHVPLLSFVRDWAHIGYYVNVKYSNNSNWDRWETQGSKVTILNLACYWWAEWFGRDNVAPRLKSPQGFRGQIWISATAASLVSPGRQRPSPGTQMLPMHTGLNATKLSPRAVKPGLRHVVVQTVHCTRMPAEGIGGGKT